MTLPVSDRSLIFVATGGEPSLDLPFRLMADRDLALWRRRSGANALLVLGPDYTLLRYDRSTRVLFNFAVLAGDRFAADGNRPKERASDLPSATALSARTLNPDLDQLQVQIQELARDQGRALRRHPLDEGDLMLPAKGDRANKVLAFNGSGAPIAGDAAGGTAAADTVEAEAGEAIEAGQPLYVDGLGKMRLARAHSLNTARVAGLAISAASFGAIAIAGRLELSLTDWSPVVGAATLTPGAVFWLSPATSGRLVSLLPSGAGEVVLEVGRAVSPSLMAIDIKMPILRS